MQTPGLHVPQSKVVFFDVALVSECAMQRGEG